jgi:bifunctional DNA-binding transcriptional regulator/antitoxin component of YhaV-PrlF toxin-antitoxin module
MNVRMTAEKQITLPDEVVEALDLEPGSEVAFTRGPAGEVVLKRAGGESGRGGRETREQIRARILRAAEEARKATSPEFAHMTTDEFMTFIRGDED